MVVDMALTSWPFGALPGSASSIMPHRTLEMCRRDKGFLETGQMKSRVGERSPVASTYRLRAFTGQRG